MRKTTQNDQNDPKCIHSIPLHCIAFHRLHSIALHCFPPYFINREITNKQIGTAISQGVEFSGVDGSMECIAVEWNGMESMECNAVEWNGMDAFWVILVILGRFANFLYFLVICWSNKRKIEMSGSFQRSVSD